MKFVARALGWATLFAVPCWLAMGPWQRVVAHAATAAMATAGYPWALKRLNIYTPCDLGIFLALVLASVAATRRQRLLAVLRGIPALLVLEVITAVLGAVQITLQQPPLTESRAAIRSLLKYVIESALLWGPILAWLALLGRYQLPALFAPPGDARMTGRGAPSRRAV